MSTAAFEPAFVEVPNDAEVPIYSQSCCSHCGSKSSTAPCRLCAGAPSISDPLVTITAVRYCSEFCRTTHESSHRPVCVRLRQRLRLLRAAEFLKKLWQIFRTSAYDIDIKAVTTDNPIQFRSYTGYSKPHHYQFWGQPFPAKDIGQQPPVVIEALKAWHTCEEASIWLKPLLEQCLDDLEITAHLITCVVEKQGLPLILTQTAANGVQRFQPVVQHVLLLIRLPSGEHWTVDPTAAQFGWRDACMNWTSWRQSRPRHGVALYKLPLFRSIDEMLSLSSSWETCRDLFKTWQKWELRDAGCLLFRGLLPRLLSGEGLHPHSLSTFGLSVPRDIVGKPEYRPLLEQIYQRLEEVFPACVREYAIIWSQRRRFETLRYTFMQYQRTFYPETFYPETLDELRRFEDHARRAQGWEDYVSCCTDALWASRDDVKDAGSCTLAEDFAKKFKLKSADEQSRYSGR